MKSLHVMAGRGAWCCLLFSAGSDMPSKLSLLPMHYRCRRAACRARWRSSSGNDIVEQARAGDKLVFCGSLVVVPDVSVITAPGQRNVMKGAGAPQRLSGWSDV